LTDYIKKLSPEAIVGTKVNVPLKFLCAVMFSNVTSRNEIYLTEQATEFHKIWLNYVYQDFLIVIRPYPRNGRTNIIVFTLISPRIQYARYRHFSGAALRLFNLV
jgi:hypothetical protein